MITHCTRAKKHISKWSAQKWWSQCNGNFTVMCFFMNCPNCLRHFEGNFDLKQKAIREVSGLPILCRKGNSHYIMKTYNSPFFFVSPPSTVYGKNMASGHTKRLADFLPIKHKVVSALYLFFPNHHHHHRAPAHTPLICSLIFHYLHSFFPHFTITTMFMRHE